MALDWFRSYLTSRSQYVEYNGTSSSYQNITCGVPQGSILGPLLFLLYINDLASVSKKFFSVLFADDSNLFLSGQNPDSLIEEMNREIVYVTDWLRANKLSLNLNKRSGDQNISQRADQELRRRIRGQGGGDGGHSTA